MLLIRLAIALLGAWSLSAADQSGFKKNVLPVVTKHCATCHSSKAKVGNLDLEQYKTADSVLANQDVWDKVERKMRDGEMPPKGAPRPAAAAVQKVSAWLRTEYGRYDRTARHDPGRVTARRLNRVEYNNTIRDLVGLDLRPADSFPVDDSGYGFDNIGDVLSLSPALLEKYMVAADRIMREAVVLPRSYRERSDRYRSDRIKQAGPPGSMEARHTFPIEGDYDIRIAIAGRRVTEDEGMQIAAYIDGRLEKTFPAFTPQNRPRNLELKIRPKAGPHVMRALFVDREGKPIDGDKNILVESFEVRGPRNPGAFEPPPSHKLILVCGEWPGKYDDACMKQIVETFARRAFRRPVTAQEVSKYYGYAKAAIDEGEVPEKALRFALQAILISPQFLFRIERDPDPASLAAHPVNDFELASRLSYFLWSSMPDEALLQAAATGQLRKPGVLEQQVRRMVADAKYSAFVENFAGQWLLLRNLDEVKPAPEKFPQFDNLLRQAMKQETLLFFENVAKEDRPLTEFLSANYTFLNERLARHYGIEGVQGMEFQRVALNTPQRGGVLTMGSLLTVTSYPNRTSPVQRGKFLMENFLNAPPPPPPPNVPSFEESTKGMTGTLRQQMEQHRANPMCASCHIKMDSLGFGLENYDAVGTWREKDGGATVDVSGSLPGGRNFQTPAELKQKLLGDRDDFTECLAEKMIIYALGRGLEKSDRTFVRQIVRNVAGDNYKFSRLIFEIVKSPPFLMRRGEVPLSKTGESAKEKRKS
ncbi:MAG: DUF1592 domain-containing protein [Acidobacteria bacterium]|nr:DUF1592 domain-containing protein [Acidobacteriota bacterium]